MHTKHGPSATHRQPSLYPERRMMRGKRGEAARLIPKPRNQGSNPGVRGFLASELMLPFLMLPVRSIRGRLGDRVYKTYGDKIIVTRVPCFDGYVPTAAQRERRAKLREATAYAQAVYADPATKAIYVRAAKQLGRQPFRLAVSDFLRGRPRVRLGLASKPRKSAAPANGINSKARKPREDIPIMCTPNRPVSSESTSQPEKACSETRRGLILKPGSHEKTLISSFRSPRSRFRSSWFPRRQADVRATVRISEKINAIHSPQKQKCLVRVEEASRINRVQGLDLNQRSRGCGIMTGAK
jgi:hypothetical protein